MIISLIVLPILMIMVGTVGAVILPEETVGRDVAGFVGSPLIALLTALGLPIANQNPYSHDAFYTDPDTNPEIAGCVATARAALGAAGFAAARGEGRALSPAHALDALAALSAG